jgi:hypothetical protein
MDPLEIYGGLHGTACITAVRVEEMAETHQTRLEDL